MARFKKTSLRVKGGGGGLSTVLASVYPYIKSGLMCLQMYVTHHSNLCHSQVQKLSKNEVLMVNIGSLSTGGRVSAVRADLAKIALTQPVCTEVGEKIALSRRVEKHWR